MATWRDTLTQALGDAANRSGVFTETAGKVYAVLYLSPGPLSLDELGQQVGTSKGNASVQVRTLLELGMVRKVSVRRSRRDYYEAVTDLWAIATEIISRRLEQEAQALLRAVQGAERDLAAGDNEGGDLLKARLSGMSIFLQTTVAMLQGFRRGDPISPDLLKNATR